MSEGNGKIPSEPGKVGYCSPPVHTRFKPGNRANPHGRPSAGASICEWFNVMRDWSRKRIEKTATSEKSTAAKRAAAQQWLAAVDGAGKSLDRICDRTAGKPKRSVDVTQRGKVRFTFNIGTAGNAAPSDN